MRMFRLAGIAVAALVVAGCFQSTTLIRVNADGSGTIEQTTLVTEAALRQLRQFAAANDESGKGTDLFSINQARQIAEAMGSDVTVVSSTRIKTAEGEGSKAVLAFPDINRIRIKQGDASEGSAGVGAAGKLLANDAAFARRQTARTMEEVRAAIKDVPGLKVNLDPEITIEFMSAKQPSRQPGGRR